MMKKIADILFVISNAVGALLIASNIGLHLYGFISFLIGNIFGMYLLKQSNASKSLMIIQVMFTVINIIGIIRV